MLLLVDIFKKSGIKLRGLPILKQHNLQIDQCINAFSNGKNTDQDYKDYDPILNAV